MTNELKPCPWCGLTPYIYVNKYRHNQETFSVKCSNPDCPIIPMTYETTEEKYAIDDWNRRFNDVE